jgi:hypothetical protein
MSKLFSETAAPHFGALKKFPATTLERRCAVIEDGLRLINKFV